MGILEFLASFDLITPAAGLMKDIANSPSTSFMLSPGEWSGRAVQRLLKAHSVDSWGMMNTPDGIIFFVREAQAEWAYYVMQREGVAVT